jgi:probable addiction module antidote protein
MKSKIKLTKWDTAETLETERDISGYLAEAFQDGDPAIVRAAMANVARSRNMAAIARDMGISTRGLYKMLSENGNPEFSSVQKFLHAIGVRMSIVPAALEYTTMTKARGRNRIAA